MNTQPSSSANLPLPQWAYIPGEMTEDEYRSETGLRPSVGLFGGPTLSERLWSGPAVDVLGIDAPRVVEASNQIVPVARAKVSLRVAPDDDAKETLMRALIDDLKRAAALASRVE